jgi:hypothetical protein
MNNDTSQFRHDRSAYERPTLGWRCGRSKNWNAPCKHGPTSLGVCGGESACAPGRTRDAWQCRRGAVEGGSCANGPDKDGNCGLRRPPCVPRRTFAMWRGRLSMLAVGTVMAFIALLALKTDMVSGRPSSLDPGPLSAAHSHFASGESCGTCHAAFGRGASGWWQAFWNPTSLMPAPQPASMPGKHRLSAACTECHGFGGHEQEAHNRKFESQGQSELKATECVMCHTEHKGRVAQITTLTEAQCQTCHTRIIVDFSENHPAFSANFPYDHPQALHFDHNAHFGKHFTEPASASKAPAAGCVGCHVVGQGGRQLRPASFEAMCANCHNEGIAKRDLVLFRWPEIETNTIKADEVSKSCGVSADAQANPPGAPAEKFSAVSSDPPTALAAYLLGFPLEDMAEYEKPVQDLARAMMSEGADPLVEATRDRLSSSKVERLFAGFDAEQARQAACAWGANQEYQPPGKAPLSGWRADALELRYTRPSHADPVLKSWIETVAAMASPADTEGKIRLRAARKEMLSATDGPGQCMKCHAVSGPVDGPLNVSWQVELRNVAAHTRFDHRPHLDLLGPEKTCTSCHQISESAESAATAGLKPIALATCVECHAAGKVRDNCRTCHVYHQDHAFRKRMMQDAKN